MQYSFFESQIERLRGVYSPSSLNAERVKVLWESFKAVPDSTFEGAVNNLIGEFTTMALPAVSRFYEAIEKFKRQDSRFQPRMEEYPSAFTCEKCRDFGFIFVGHDVMPCVLCETGRGITAEEIERQQKAYNLGKQFMQKGALTRKLSNLPYDPNERIESA